MFTRFLLLFQFYSTLSLHTHTHTRARASIVLERLKFIISSALKSEVNYESGWMGNNIAETILQFYSYWHVISYYAIC
jgi:flagellin-specific chaperone FliS